MAESGSRLASLVRQPSFVAGHPSLAALLQARDALASYPMPGVNVHAQPDLSQAWLQEQTIEPVAFGSFADPVSQLAFLMAPGVLRGLKGTLEAAATPGPGLRGLMASERGNLGPPPVGPQGEPLPGSVVRDAEGRLQRLYHGTPNRFPDFDMRYMDPEGLYGPGVYMTQSADVAGGAPAEVARGYMGYASKGYSPDNAALTASWRDTLRYRTQEMAGELEKLTAQASRPASTPALQANNLKRLSQMQERYDVLQQDLARVEQQVALELSQGPHIRPVYADLRQPFDMAASFDTEGMNAALANLPKADAARIIEGTRAAINQSGTKLSNQTFYEGLVQAFGDKEQANAYLQKLGYDGITHMGGAVTGGQPHRVYISFTSDNVYPSFNVDALRQR